jgi:tryptophan-rich sensory protein
MAESFGAIEWVGFVLWLGLSAIAYGLSGNAWRTKAGKTWYRKLNAILHPDPMFFYFGWVIAYAVYGTASFLVWRMTLDYGDDGTDFVDMKSDVNGPMYHVIIAFHIAGLVSASVWARLFFGKKMIVTSTVIAVFAWGLAVSQTILAYVMGAGVTRISSWWLAGTFYAVYVIYLSIVAFVNASIAYLNSSEQHSTFEDLTSD